MGLFVREDPVYNEAYRMTGFNRYKQLLSFHAGNWIKANLITTIGFLPLACVSIVSLMSSSSLLMSAGGLIGGLIFGPFLAAMVSSIMKGLMDSPEMFWDNYKKAWKQNIRSSLLPGAVAGLFSGMFLFMGYMLLESSQRPSVGTIAISIFALFIFLFFNTLLWPQLVLFDQTFLNRCRNILLFGTKYFWKVSKAVLFEILWLTILVIFSPITFLVIPFLGFWFVIFISQFILYEDLNEELQIEELYSINQ